MTVIVQGGRVIQAASSPLAKLRETVADVTRAVEDRNWTNLSTDPNMVGLDEDFSRRVEMITRLRLYRRRSPLAKQAAKLLQHYVLGQGVSLRPTNRTQVAKIVDEFWDDPTNQSTFTSHAAMSEFLDTVFVDGDVFLLLQPDTELGSVKLGTIDVLRVEDIVADPDNWRIPLWYKVRKSKAKYDFAAGVIDVATSTESEVVWYRDWRNDQPAGRGKGPAKVEDGLVYHVAINKRGKFGDPEMAVAADWIKAHKEFMEDRATIHKASAQVGWKETHKGPTGVVAQQVQRLQSALSQSLAAGWESNPPAATASTAIQNEGVNLEWGGANPGSAGADEKLFRMMVGSGMGVMNHYFGDEGGARLATATAMELPMLKNYEHFQKMMTDVIADLIDFALTVANAAGRIGDRDDQSKYSDKRQTDTNVAVQGDDQVKTQDQVIPTKEGFREVYVAGRTWHAAASNGDEPWRKMSFYDDIRARRVNTRESDRQTRRVLRRTASAIAQKDLSLFKVDLEEAQAVFSEAPPQPQSQPPAPEAGNVQQGQQRPQTGPYEGSVTTVPSYLQLVPTAISPRVGDEEFDSTGNIDWYVDVDFPPIVQKDINTYMFALSSMYNMMPLTNLEAQKLIVSMALTAFGVNDVPEVMDKLFSPLEFLPSNVQVERDMAMHPSGTMDDYSGMTLDQAMASGAPSSGASGQQQAAAQQPAPQGGVGAPAQAQTGVGAPVKEAQLPARTRRVLNALRETSEAIAAAGHSNGNGAKPSR